MNSGKNMFYNQNNKISNINWDIFVFFNIEVSINFGKIIFFKINILINPRKITSYKISAFMNSGKNIFYNRNNKINNIK